MIKKKDMIQFESELQYQTKIPKSYSPPGGLTANATTTATATKSPVNIAIVKYVHIDLPTLLMPPGVGVSLRPCFL